MSRGFLRTAAPFRTDLVFTIELGMGAALLVGMVLARIALLNKQLRDRGT